jgi:WD40 repeat protein
VSIAVASPPSPFKGLAPFEDSDLDALLFFGREVESEVIAANLMAARMTVLYGPSGVGKSSVLRAGVAHRLRLEEGVDVVVFSTWTGDPVAALIEAVGGSGESLVDALEESADRAGGDVFLILDQFEEYFLYHPPGGPFAAELAEIVRRPGLRVNVLVGMREDALARLDALKATIPNLLGNRLRLERLDAEAGRAAILGPIERYNTLVAPEDPVAIEPELVDDVLHEVTVGRVELSVAGRGLAAGVDENLIEAPFLQLVLARLWDLEAERGSRTLRRETLGELGGAQRIVENHLERAMAELSPQEKGAAAAMYHFLVTPSGTKIAHGVRDLAGYASVDEDEAAGVLQRLTSERIVRASSTNGPSTTRYEIFHDVLADAVLAWRSRFEADRRLEEQRRAHERRQRRLLAIGAGALLGLAVMAAVAVYALAQRSNAQHQAALAKAEQAKTQSALDETRKARRGEHKALLKAQEKERGERRAVKKEKAATRRATDLAVREKRERLQAQDAEAREAASADYARGQTRLAHSATRRANRETRKVIAQKKIIGARALATSAEALLDTDPQKSVTQTLRAIAAFHRAKRAPGVGVEDTLRDGLIDLRLKARLAGPGAVEVVRYSPNGSVVLVAGRGGARLFERTASGWAFRSRLRPASGIVDATFSPDGRLVAAVGGSSTARIWDVQTGFPLLALQHGGNVLSVAFSADGRLIATGSADGFARLWSVAGGVELAPFKHDLVPGQTTPDDVRMVSFSPDSKRLLTVAVNRFARVFDVARHEQVFRLDHGTVVNVARFSHDGRLIATGGNNEFVRIWNASNGAPAMDRLEGTGKVADLAFSPNDKLLATAETNDSTGHVWRLRDRTAVAVFTHHLGGVASVTFSPLTYSADDRGSVVTTGGDGNAYIHRSESSFVQGVLLGHTGPVNAADFSPDGSEIVTGSDDGFARVWDARVDPVAPLAPAAPRQIGKHAGAVNSVAISRDGTRTLSAGDDGITRILGPGARVVELRQTGKVAAASFSTDARRVITGSDDGTARLWSTADGRLLRTFAHKEPVVAVRLSRDGRLALTAAGDSAWLWDVRRGRVSHRLTHGDAVNDARFSLDDGRVVTAGADSRAVVWRVRDGRALAKLVGHRDDVVAAAFAPDGRSVATASLDSTARIWNARTGKLLHALSGHESALTALAFSPGGRWLATASRDSDARVWSARSGRLVARLRFHSGTVNDVAFSFDGRWLATAGPTTIGIWQTGTRKTGRWLAHPLHAPRVLATIGNPAVTDVAFSGRGWRVVFGNRDGSVQAVTCALCGTVKELSAIARARLQAIKTVRP